MRQYDVVIIGAGVVGSSIARRFAAGFGPRGRVLVLERNVEPGLETSRLNSGVIHSGIHLNPSFLKARLAREGSRIVPVFCREHGVRCEKVGMYIAVAAGDVLHLAGETRNLFRLLDRARRQRIPVRLVRRVRPSVRTLFALWIPEVSIVDPLALTRAIVADALGRGATFRYHARVSEIVSGAQTWLVRAGSEEYRARLVVNAAGLYADQVARLAGYEYRQVFYRGEYCQVDPAAGLDVRSLVYPVSRPGDAGLGVHITPTVDGRLLLGPNAVRICSPEDQTVCRTSVETFFQAVRRFLPTLRPEHVRWSHAGVRPKLTSARIENDFRVVREPGGPPFVNLIGIESPGLTAALPLADYVYGLVREHFNAPPLTLAS